MAEKSSKRGFTLIELSIVLVIIGLIAGGILVGQDMISAARVRSQITQLDQLRAAANVFKDKYGCLPGDLSKSRAVAFGFLTGTSYRAGDAGRGDCNGLLQGYGMTVNLMSESSAAGEPMMFFEDLSSANLIGGQFNSFDPANWFGVGAGYASTDLYLPAAKMGTGNYVLIASGGLGANAPYSTPGLAVNYFHLAVVTLINGGGSCQICTAGLTSSEAYSLDTKTDDGLPMTGKTRAMFLGSNFATYGGPTQWSTNAAAPSATTCFDTTSKQYSTSTSNNSSLNCGLSFQF